MYLLLLLQLLLSLSAAAFHLSKARLQCGKLGGGYIAVLCNAPGLVLLLPQQPLQCPSFSLSSLRFQLLLSHTWLELLSQHRQDFTMHLTQ